MAVLFVQDIGQIGVQHRLKTQGAQVTLQDPLEQIWKLKTKQDLTEYYWISGIQKVSMSNFGDVTPLWTTSISWFKKNGTTIADQLKANVGSTSTFERKIIPAKFSPASHVWPCSEKTINRPPEKKPVLCCWKFSPWIHDGTQRPSWQIIIPKSQVFFSIDRY